MTAALVLAASYLLGSIPFSYLVARQRGIDVRSVGSGNVGATNVMRSVGKGAGLLAFVLDAAKGSLAAVIALRPASAPRWRPLAAVAAIVGHMYPVWLRFRGGKGVATGAGAFLPLAPVATGVALVVFALTLAVTRYVSLGSMVSAIALALVAAFAGAPPPVVDRGRADGGRSSSGSTARTSGGSRTGRRAASGGRVARTEAAEDDAPGGRRRRGVGHCAGRAPHAGRATSVRLWARAPSSAREINERHRPERYLPGVALPAALRATDDLARGAPGRRDRVRRHALGVLPRRVYRDAAAPAARRARRWSRPPRGSSWTRCCA